MAEPGDLRRWLGQRRLAAQRERSEMQRAVLPPHEAFEHGLAMIALAQRLCGWPVPEDESERREDEQAYRRWATLRRRLRVA